jgi:hypothetical protein
MVGKSFRHHYYTGTDLGRRLHEGEPVAAFRPSYADPPHTGAPDWWLELQPWACGAEPLTETENEQVAFLRLVMGEQ